MLSVAVCKVYMWVSVSSGHSYILGWLCVCWHISVILGSLLSIVWLCVCNTEGSCGVLVFAVVYTVEWCVCVVVWPYVDRSAAILVWL